MIEPVADVEPPTLDRYDDIIDVRSSAEFSEDRLPRAVNIPVLTDEERAEVGTIYTQESKFRARRIGAAYVARNVAHALAGALADRPAKYRPLLYCWRGGMRSHAMATVLSQIGWRVGVLQGGYKTWRRKVVRELHEEDAPLNLLLVDGQTGTAKSEILRRVAASGGQALDLEVLAAHRGSVFGALGQAQPSQRQFESQIWEPLSRFDLSRPVLIEAESAAIGRLAIPRRLWRSMRAAPHVILRAPSDARAAYLVSAYADLIARPDQMSAALDRLAPFHSKETVKSWRRMVEAQDFRALAMELMRSHYDPLYERGRKSRAGLPVAEFSLKTLAAGDIDAVARRLSQLTAEQAADRVSPSA